jgi:hypothetical protein
VPYSCDFFLPIFPINWKLTITHAFSKRSIAGQLLSVQFDRRLHCCRRFHSFTVKANQVAFKSMKRKTRSTFLVILILLAQCSKTIPDTDTTLSVRTLTWELPGRLSTIDWTECNNPVCLQHATLVMDGLYKLIWNGTDWELENALAENLELNEKSFLISIKKNIRWTDSKLLTSDDFLIGWKKVLSNCQTLDRFPIWQNVSGAQAYCRGEKKWTDVGIKSRGDHAIEIFLDKGHEEFTRSVAYPLFYPHRGNKKSTATLGPYVLQEHSTPQVERGARYIKNPLFYGPPPVIDEIHLLTQRPALAALASVTSRQTQFTGPLPSTNGLDNVDPKNRLLVPTPVRYAVAANPPAGTHSVMEAWRKLQWEEPQKLAMPFAIGCAQNKLCSHSELPSGGRESRKPIPALHVSAENAEAMLLAQNLAAQWKAIHQTWAQASLGAAAPAASMQGHVFRYQHDPHQGKFASLELFGACQTVFSARQWPLEPGFKPLRSSRAAGVTQSEIKKMEGLWWKTMKCIPLAVQTQPFVKDPELHGMLWTAHQTWDFSRATLPILRKRRLTPEG